MWTSVQSRESLVIFVAKQDILNLPAGGILREHASSIGWVNPRKNSSDIDSSDGDYRVMAVRHKKLTEFKIAGVQLSIGINGRASRVWIDNGSPISIFTIGEQRRTLGGMRTMHTATTGIIF